MISAEPDRDLDAIARTIVPNLRISGRSELELQLGRLLAASECAAAIAPKTLDLVGHSTAGASLLQLGDWTIDAGDPAVQAWFRRLADRGVLPRLGIHAVRLLGCTTARPGPGSATLGALAAILGVEIYGTDHLLQRAHYDEQGFRDTWEFLLVSASELRDRERAPCAIADTGWPRPLDLDALPVSAQAPRADQAAARVATASTTQQILQLIRRDAGARMLGVPAAPLCELALWSGRPGTYHVAHVLLDGAFVRFYPDGFAVPGVVYPVDDARLLRRILDSLPEVRSIVDHAAHPEVVHDL
jgi:hypothetical protein